MPSQSTCSLLAACLAALMPLAPAQTIDAPHTRGAGARPSALPRPEKPQRSGTGLAFPGIPREKPYLSLQPDGSPQVRARTYKAAFTPAGAEYVPFCGSAAPENHPLRLRLREVQVGGEPLAFDAAASARLDAQSVRYARGSLDEVYEIGADGLEQLFVFDSLPRAGELVLRIDVETGLQAERDADGLVFTSADGSVRYGAATLVDARGASFAADTQLVDGGLEIRVPARALAQAVAPLAIDPLLTTFGVHWSLEPVDSYLPALDWDETNQRYCVVYEETFSATDHDVLRAFVDPGGNLISADYVDSNLGDFWSTPDVADNNAADQFLIVAAVGIPGGGGRTIHGRTVDAAGGVLGPDLLISTSDEAGEKITPTVGGDPYVGSTTYTVAWTRIYTPGIDNDIHFRQVDVSGLLLGGATQWVDDSAATFDRFPRISKSCQEAGVFHIVWERTQTATDRDTYAAEIQWDGLLQSPPTAIVTTGDTTRPSCSPVDDAGRWLLAYAYDYGGGDHDIEAVLLSGITPLAATDISDQEDMLGSGALFSDQIHPAVTTDGLHFALAYSEQYGTSPTDYDICVATVDAIQSQLVVGEAHQYVAYSTRHEDFPRLCSQQSTGGASNTVALAWWDSGGPNLGDIGCGVYATGDFAGLCTPGASGVQPCPCANANTVFGRGCDNSSGTGGATLAGAGHASLASDSVQFSGSGLNPSSLAILTQASTLIPSGIAFGQGIRCAGGMLKRLYARHASAGAVSIPVPGDPDVHTRSAALGDVLGAGSVRYYYLHYRDPIVLGGCPQISTFNASSAVQVVWRP